VWPGIQSSTGKKVLAHGGMQGCKFDAAG
jgi:hypothetical protein